MASQAFLKSISKDLPIVFVNIGWAIHYDGTEAIVGNHKHLKNNPGSRVGESNAFKSVEGYFECGVGSGKLPERFHVAFVARDPGSQVLKLVGLYANANAQFSDNNWAFASSRFAARIPSQRRPQVATWPTGQGMRRWAARAGNVGATHKALRAMFAYVLKCLRSKAGLPRNPTPADDESAFEGELKKRYHRHRRREAKLRSWKIADAIHKNSGRLVCEVRNCRFDFEETYGELGAGFAEVHHLKPLKYAPRRGQKTSLRDLAIVCANCHRMIHQNGECRALADVNVLTK